MSSLSTYLTFDGNCEIAFNYYKSVFGGEFTVLNYFREMPPSEENKLPEGYGDRIMHVSLPIGDSLLMGSDSGGEWGPPLSVGDNFSISVNADSKEQADKLFAGLSKEGKVGMPLANTFWGSYFGTCTDKFGINWMVSFDQEPKED